MNKKYGNLLKDIGLGNIVFNSCENVKVIFVLL